MNKSLEVVIVLNPGSTSTKFALWSRTGCVTEQVVRHEAELLAPSAADQFEYRRQLIDADILPLLQNYKVVGAVGRGGLLKPLPGGTYFVNEAMLSDLKLGRSGNHASNLGALLADYYAQRFGFKAFIVDPVTVDEFSDLARLSGAKWIQRKSRSHALNIKAVSRRAASQLGKMLNDTRFVVAHLGGGTSIAAVAGGRIIDVNDALLGMGPYSPERAGALPIGPLVEKCFSGEITREKLLSELSRQGGLMSYCGSSDAREVLERAHNGNQTADLALRGMIYQDAKEIGAIAAALQGRLDAVVITGGLAHSEEIMGMLKPYIEFLGQILVFPGEGELEALAEGAFRVIDGEEEGKEYS
ncbi:MAG: butyrate kinase [Calditrichota bacterium]